MQKFSGMAEENNKQRESENEAIEETEERVETCQHLLSGENEDARAP